MGEEYYPSDSTSTSQVIVEVPVQPATNSAENNSQTSNSETTASSENKTSPETATASATSPNYEQISKEGLDKLIDKYYSDGVIDKDELIDIVQHVIENVEKNKDLNGADKKKVALNILRQFLENKVNNYDNLEILLDKSIDYAVNVSKNGFEKIKFSSGLLTDTKTAFNFIYANALSKINEKYPQADDIINHIFDIAIYVMSLLEGQTSLNENEKKVLLKKILIKLINDLESKLSAEQSQLLLSQVDHIVIVIQIGLRASEGLIKINMKQVSGFCSKIFCCCSKKTG